MSNREASITRKTSETDISVKLSIDGMGKSDIDTGIGFFDHMLEGFSKHGFFDLDVKCKGDLIVDGHHTIEDVGIVIGQAIKDAVGDKKGIKRFGYFVLPMDEACCICAIDLSGRPYLVYDAQFTAEKIGYLETEMIKEFFYAISYTAGMNINIKMMSGSNNHHIAESMFKAFGKALDMATSYDERIEDVLSTKGAL